MQKYNKLIVAAVGLVVLFIGPDGLGLTSSEQATQIGDGIISLVTAAMVYLIPNKEDPNAIADLKP